MLCGYRSYSAIGQWGRTYPPQLAVVLGFTYPKTPCASTLGVNLVRNVSASDTPFASPRLW